MKKLCVFAFFKSLREIKNLPFFLTSILCVKQITLLPYKLA